MSLQVWLPLTKDLKNQGLSNATISIMRGNETWNNSGKLGKCFYANGVNTLQINNIIPQLYNIDGYSLCAWFCIESQNTVHSGAGIISGGNWNNQVLNLSVSDWSSDHYTKLRVSGTNWNNTYTYNFYKNIWYHAVVCSDGNKTYAYINGQLIGDTVAGFLPSSIEGNNIAIGGATYYSGMQFFGKINDVRIYDHCLSPIEVKELAKGLVLHYPLNRSGWGQENLLLNSNDLTLWSIEGNGKIELQEDGYFKVSSKASNTTRYGIYYDFTFPEPNTYTFSVDVKDDWLIGVAPASTFAWTAANLSGTQGKKRISYTCTSTEENNKCRIYIAGNGTGGRVTYLKQPKFEKGSIATPWCPNSSDVLATTMGLNSTTEYDCSGFCNNGTWHGTHTNTSDTPKYTVSTTATGGETTYLEGPVLPTEAQTAALWIKSKKSQNAAIFNDKTTGLQIGLLNSLLYMNSKTSTAGFTTTHWKDDDWNHVVVTYDGTTRKAYINGQTETQSGASNYYIHNANNCWVWNRSYNNNYPFTGSLCDLRVYATALSADDVKSLYQNSAYIDSSGNVYGTIHEI